jgi:poly-gamma-glutamate capsule biosynthesis protein CapA/YwtB (metallophosphatase superfamily)
MNPSEASKNRPVTLFLCGDVMTGRGVDQILPHPSNPRLHEPYVESALEYVAMAERTNGPIPKPVSFSYVWGDALAELDRVAPTVRIINLETSVTTSWDLEPKGINYRMHPSNTPCLNAAKIDCCVLANNHVLDWGRSGLADTTTALGKAGLKFAGAGRNLVEAWQPAAMETNVNSRVLVFSVGAMDSGVDSDWAATESRPGIAVLSDFSDRTVTRIAEHVKAAKRPGDVVILSIHWGGNWGYEVSGQHRAFAHKLIDTAAVDVVHGHSSHHPMGIEVYHGKPILYGCGDFLDDYEGIRGHEQYRSHLVLAYFVTLDPATKKLLRLEMAPFEIKRFSLHHASTQDSEWLRDRMAREGKALGTQVSSDAQNRLILSWQGADRAPLD